MIKIAINGFGRIGRTAVRILAEKYADKIELVAINTSGSMETEGWAHLLKYDTAYGRFNRSVKFTKLHATAEATDNDPVIGQLMIEDLSAPILLLAQRDPAKLPWKDYGIDVVLECTGIFVTAEKAKAHLSAGAKRVLISAPPKGGGIGTFVLGVNQYQKGEIISNASCTTNCVAPVAAILHSKFGVEKASLLTIHAYTDDQNLQDNSHKDLRRARAAAHNLVPTTTGAAISTAETIPELKGLFDGLAIRAPVISGSICDITAVLKKNTTVEEVNLAFIEASQSPRWQGILAVTDEPLVSSDIIGRPESAIVDLSLTQVIGGNLVKVLAWYDNEYGYCYRLIEQTIEVGKKI
ncbi:type I glyceraldehyde-3-phosphate dehydrogenase [Candidatus Collierbacteria bacterium]|nr:type I glyceraldehyde-3-phosphate dehydrogenase [Candidatus Collierbacteria bacterium]